VLCQRRACPRALRVLLAAALLCALGRGPGAGARSLQQANQAFYPGAAPLDQATQAQARLPLCHAWLRHSSLRQGVLLVQPMVRQPLFQPEFV
jgi:hypothetical protein